MTVGRLPSRFPRPLTTGQLHAVPLRVLARPAPIGTGAVRVDPECLVHQPGRELTARWAGRVAPCSRCAAPVRQVTVVDALVVLGDEEWPGPPQLECLWCGPAGQVRAHPAAGPVPVCMEPTVRRFP